MKRTLTMLLSVLLALTGCAGPGGRPSAPSAGSGELGTEPVRTGSALSEPVYPKFPKRPVPPEDGPAAEWDTYFDDYKTYMDALAAVRGEDGGLSQEELDVLNAFAAKSTPLALAGREGENTIYSPLSLWSALAMGAQCAGGNSREQVLEAVGADSVDLLQEMTERVWKQLYTDDGQSSLILANSIWLNTAAGGRYVQETLDALAQRYYAGAYTVPMGTAGADQAVTGWVNKQTNGLIGGDQPVVETSADTLAMLVSSLYYRAGWTDEFAPERTQKDTFTGADGQESQADFMHAVRSGSKFLRREEYQAAALPTQLGDMVFVLPDQGVTPESLLQDPEFLTGLDFRGQDSRSGEVRWSVPKFDVNSNLDLLEMLEGLGVTDLLDRERADLSALTDLPAYLSGAVQMARVKVDEEGVEAAAVTVLEVMFESAPIDSEVCVMDLDRPFLFVIRSGNLPLFVGTVNQL